MEKSRVRFEKKLRNQTLAENGGKNQIQKSMYIPWYLSSGFMVVAVPIISTIQYFSCSLFSLTNSNKEKSLEMQYHRYTNLEFLFNASSINKSVHGVGQANEIDRTPRVWKSVHFWI